MGGVGHSGRVNAAIDQFRYRALHEVGRGEIGTTSMTGALRHWSADLSPCLVGALSALYRDGYVTVRRSRTRDGWCPAELTHAGMQLLAEWEIRALETRAQAG